ncbi:hypothetical protein llap_20575 [Limosa lapponica baueri]|uniref:Uncharacterized protein n=1 Tax=Limosa lapponica baueri TaxID=1758121 RepID=A0A2I0T5Q1_LIMLA|nr:hypothetical protein llap_20575 [Limosa lapponica baueri]
MIIELDTEGCLSQVFSSNTFELNRIGYMRNLDVKAIVTEKGTGWIEPSYPDASLSIQRFYSWTSSFVRIEPLWQDLKCGQKRLITVHYVLNTEGYKSINTMNFYYVVRLQFSEERMRSAFNVSLVLEAAANSFCAVRAVDKSVLLLKSETELSAETIYSLHPLQDFQGYIFNGLNLEDDPQDPCVSSDNIFHKGLYYTPVMSGLGPDVYQFLRDMGMKFFTNSKVRQPVVCSSETVRRPQYFLNAGFMASTHHVKSSAEVAREERGKRLIVETIREFFPETWIWDIVLIK